MTANLCTETTHTCCQWD